jgi:hypothetical protein
MFFLPPEREHAHSSFVKAVGGAVAIGLHMYAEVGHLSDGTGQPTESLGMRFNLEDVHAVSTLQSRHKHIDFGNVVVGG